MTDRPKSRRMRIAAAGALLIVVALVAAGLGLARGTRSHVVPPPSAAKLVELGTKAMSVAAGNGDSRPTGGTVVATTRKAINRLNGGSEVNTDEDVYVVTLHGNFTAYGASVPSGALPTGHLLVLVFDAKTSEVADFMLGDYPIDATKLGEPTPLP